ncbi:MAG TPA: hypothetical protein VEJ16_13810 [Alphaproteobacteria bacterium]|nr:hypothetical protein [Alphaproteobacteria bacterium]
MQLLILIASGVSSVETGTIFGVGRISLFIISLFDYRAVATGIPVATQASLDIAIVECLALASRRKPGCTGRRTLARGKSTESERGAKIKQKPIHQHATILMPRAVPPHRNLRLRNGCVKCRLWRIAAL